MYGGAEASYLLYGDCPSLPPSTASICMAVLKPRTFNMETALPYHQVQLQYVWRCLSPVPFIWRLPCLTTKYSFNMYGGAEASYLLYGDCPSLPPSTASICMAVLKPRTFYMETALPYHQVQLQYVWRC